MAWGSGNPDLSGIGANIAYVIQVTLTPICGPALCGLYVLGQTSYLNLSERTKSLISKIHDTFLDVNAQFSVPVAIAACIRQRQNAPFYEIAFLRRLITMQLYSLMSTIVLSLLFRGEHRRSYQRFVTMISYGVAEFVFYNFLSPTWPESSGIGEISFNSARFAANIKTSSPGWSGTPSLKVDLWFQ